MRIFLNELQRLILTYDGYLGLCLDLFEIMHEAVIIRSEFMMEGKRVIRVERRLLSCQEAVVRSHISVATMKIDQL